MKKITKMLIASVIRVMHANNAIRTVLCLGTIAAILIRCLYNIEVAKIITTSICFLAAFISGYWVYNTDNPEAFKFTVIYIAIAIANYFLSYLNCLTWGPWTTFTITIMMFLLGDGFYLITRKKQVAT